MRLKFWRKKWHVFADDGKRTSLRTDCRALAEQRYADIQAHQRQQITIIGDIVAAYMQDRTGRVRNIDSIKYSWQALSPHFAALRPDQLTRQHSRDYTDARRAKGISDGTIIRDLGVLRAAIAFAGHAAVIERPSAPPPRDFYLTRQQFSKLMRAAHNKPHLRLFAALGLATGARPSHILELTWPQVLWQRRQIHMGIGYGRKGRPTVPINDSLYRELKTAHEIATTGRLIEYRDKPVASIKKAWATACKDAGLPQCGPGCLRHTAAVWMAESGTPMAEISQYLGHTDTRTTEKHYARFSPDYLRNAASALEW